MEKSMKVKIASIILRQLNITPNMKKGVKPKIAILRCFILRIITQRA